MACSSYDAAAMTRLACLEYHSRTLCKSHSSPLSAAISILVVQIWPDSYHYLTLQVARFERFILLAISVASR